MNIKKLLSLATNLGDDDFVAKPYLATSLQIKGVFMIAFGREK